MSILIKGMEMPNDCIDCFAETYNECMVTGRLVNSLGRPDWCPLVDFPLERGEKIVKVRKKINSTVSWSITIVGTWEDEKDEHTYQGHGDAEELQ